MRELVFVISAVMFFILTPGVMVSLPPGCDTYTTALFHAVLFAILWMLLKPLLYKWLYPAVPIGLAPKPKPMPPKPKPKPMPKKKEVQPFTV
jgi:hypothetical protein